MKYANHIGYSDVDPYEIVRIVSEKTIEIREMKTEPDTSVELKWVAGGFAGHCVNQNEQKWIISSDETAPVIRIRLGKRGWKDKYGRKFFVDSKPVKFYDHNF